MANNELKRIWFDLKKSPAVLITVVIAIILILYYIYQQNNAGGTGITATSSDTGFNNPVYTVQTTNGTGPGATNGAPTTGGTTTTTTPPLNGGQPPTAGPVLGSTKAIQSGALASVAGGTNAGGKNIGTVPAGASVDVLAGPQTFVVSGITNKYYQVKYNSLTGWVNAKTLGL